MGRIVTVIEGDGIGPEIMRATLRALDNLDCGLEYEFVEAGLVALERQGEILPETTLESIRRNGLVLKGPLTTPIGKGFRSLNVGLRLEFDLYANVRPVVSIPGTRSRYSDVDIITVRENTEGAYLAADATVSADGSRAESKMIITRAGSERVARYAFDLARSENRRKVTLVHKANILKAVSGLFLDVARDVASGYPDIQCEEMIVDAACMNLVLHPERFDVIVTTNLFGDIISDLCAGLVGGLGLAPGANIGKTVGMFEAVHGSAPDIAGKGVANPCALMLGAAMMLVHIGKSEQAATLRSAIVETIGTGDRVTPDLGGNSSTEEFADAIIQRLSASPAA